MRFAFVHAEKARFPVGALCRVMEVTRQGYHAYATRPPSKRAERDRVLQEDVGRVHAQSRGTYGSPRVREQLVREGLTASKRRVERALRSQGLAGVSRGGYRTTTKANPKHPTEPNTLDRDFTATRPNQRWVTDITYIWTAEGWCYLAAILDLYSRRVVGWSLDTTLSTKLALSALNMALGQRDARDRDLLHHSDRGCQYTCKTYRNKLASVGIEVSMSRTGNCWDNAVSESFFATLKTELVYRHKWAGRAELRAAVFDYIEVFYNRQRLHSALDYQTPAEAEDAYVPVAA